MIKITLSRKLGELRMNQAELARMTSIRPTTISDLYTIVPSRTNDRVLPTLTASEINYLAFGIASVDYHIALYGRLQLMAQKHRIIDCDAYIVQQPDYDRTKHERIDNSAYGNYSTWPTYIRNAIDHPDSGRQFTLEEL